MILLPPSASAHPAIGVASASDATNLRCYYGAFRDATKRGASCEMTQCTILPCRARFMPLGFLSGAYPTGAASASSAKR